MTKVLCLCGYTQSASIFRGRLAALRKQCTPGTSFTFLDPPHIVPAVNLPASSLVQYDSTDSATSEDELPRAWFFAKDIEGVSGGRKYEGLDETYELLKNTLEKERFDVVLGFSQGAAIAGALAAMLTRSDCQIQHPPFKLAVLVSGFAMYDPQGSIFPPNNGRSPAETLHIIGRGDTIVSNERSQTLVDKFDSPRIEYHDGGHFLPSRANFRKFLKAIFDSLSSNDDTSTGTPVGGWREIPSPGAASETATPVESGRSTPVVSSSGKL